MLKVRTSSHDGAPNLDRMTAENLLTFAMRYRGRPSLLVLNELDPGDTPTEQVDHVAHCLVAYAFLKHIAITHRAAGEISKALLIEANASRLYDELPDFARW